MQTIKVFKEVANDGRFPYIDALPNFAQATVHRIEKLGFVKSINASITENKQILAINIFLDRPRAQHHIDLVLECLDHDLVRTNYYSLTHGVNRITMHLIPTKTRLN